MRVRIWDEHTGNLVGSIEKRGFIDIIWFAPSLQTSMEECPNEPGHYSIHFQAVDRGRYLMTHAYLGIPTLDHGHEEAHEPL